MTGSRSITMEFSLELASLNKTIVEQEMIIDGLRLQSAMYKASFFKKGSLADKLSKQIINNHLSCMGGCSAVYKTLDDMLREDLITQEEYKFCER